MLNLVLSVIAGFVLWSVLWLGGGALVQKLFPGAVAANGATSHSGLLVSLLGLSILASLAAGYVSRFFLQDPAAAPQLYLGVILLAVGIFVQRQYWTLMPLWYHLAFLALIIPVVLYGARLHG
jgi:hypothetical protein